MELDESSAEMLTPKKMVQTDIRYYFQTRKTAQPDAEPSANAQVERHNPEMHPSPQRGVQTITATNVGVENVHEVYLGNIPVNVQDEQDGDHGATEFALDEGEIPETPERKGAKK